MLESKSAVLKPKFERATRRFNQLDNRIKAYNKRVTEDVTEERVSRIFLRITFDLFSHGSRSAGMLDRVMLNALLHPKTRSWTQKRSMLISIKRQ
jgi:hypothetical protein